MKRSKLEFERSNSSTDRDFSAKFVLSSELSSPLIWALPESKIAIHWTCPTLKSVDKSAEWSVESARERWTVNSVETTLSTREICREFCKEICKEFCREFCREISTREICRKICKGICKENLATYQWQKRFVVFSRESGSEAVLLELSLERAGRVYTINFADNWRLFWIASKNWGISVKSFQWTYFTPRCFGLMDASRP